MANPETEPHQSLLSKAYQDAHNDPSQRETILGLKDLMRRARQGPLYDTVKAAQDDRPVRRQSAVRKMRNPVHEVQPFLAPIIRKYNLYAEVLGSRARSPQPWESASRALAVEQDVIELYSKLMKKIEDLRECVGTFSREVVLDADERWYRHGQEKGQDWTKYFRIELDRALNGQASHPHINDQNTPILRVTDSHDFAQYLREALPAAIRSAGPNHDDALYTTLGSARRTNPPDSNETFCARILTLIRKVEENADWDVAFHLYIFAMTDLRMINPLAESSRPQPSTYRYYYHSLGNAYRDFALKAHEAYLIGEHRGSVSYWAFTSVWRSIWREWMARDEDEKKDREALGFVKFAHREAVKETRNLTYLALSGSRTPSLPVEMAELIAEHVLAAEEVPLAVPKEARISEES